MNFARRTGNPKRRIRPTFISIAEADQFKSLAGKVRYNGNPAHKRSPGDFALRPPIAPRLGKTMCDVAGIFKREEAQALLRQGLQSGMASIREVNGWPQCVWAVTKSGYPLEAQLESSGVYHG